jgi:hypothetical protein
VILFPMLAVISGMGLLKNWSIEESERATNRVIGWIIAIPLIVAAFVIATWGIVSFFGWLATIPSWAAVIIILLLINLGRGK